MTCGGAGVGFVPAASSGCPRCCEHRRVACMRRLLDLSFDLVVEPLLDHALLEHRRYIYLIPSVLYRRVCVIRARPRKLCDDDDHVDAEGSAPLDFVNLFLRVRDFLSRTSLLSNLRHYDRSSMMDEQGGNSSSPLEKYTKYLCYVFGDDPDIIRIITSFSSSRHLAANTRTFDSPLFVETGGLFGFNKRTFRIDTPLERSIFEVLQRMQKLDFYQPVIEQLRAQLSNIGYVVSTLERVSNLNVSPLQINKLFSDLMVDFDRLFKQFFYHYFMNLDEQTVRSWFSLARSSFDSYEIEVLSLCKNIRESLADCCANRGGPGCGDVSSVAVQQSHAPPDVCCTVDGHPVKRNSPADRDQAAKHQRSG